MHSLKTYTQIIFQKVVKNYTTSQISKNLNVTRSSVKYTINKFRYIIDSLGDVSQLEEEVVLKTIQCGFESHHRHQSKPFEVLLGREELQQLIYSSFNIAEVIQKLDLDINNNNHRRKLCKLLTELSIDTSNLSKLQKPYSIHFDYRNPLSIFCKNGACSTTVKKILFRLKIKEQKCEKCNNKEWLSQNITLELHHIDGDNTNHTLDNLQILCPNCHSQTSNYKTGNRKHWF